jgi:hypothetical protein
MRSMVEGAEAARPLVDSGGWLLMLDREVALQAETSNDMEAL